MSVRQQNRQRGRREAFGEMFAQKVSGLSDLTWLVTSNRPNALVVSRERIRPMHIGSIRPQRPGCKLGLEILAHDARSLRAHLSDALRNIQPNLPTLRTVAGTDRTRHRLRRDARWIAWQSSSQWRFWHGTIRLYRHIRRYFPAHDEPLEKKDESIGVRGNPGNESTNMTRLSASALR
jgi:tRNA threonylcarbamoyladenosine modification (KEOPS) complex  Pcc1 subunit